MSAEQKTVDVHQATADKLGVPRDVGKRVNYIMLYGTSEPMALAMATIAAKGGKTRIGSHLPARGGVDRARHMENKV